MVWHGISDQVKKERKNSETSQIGQNNQKGTYWSETP